MSLPLQECEHPTVSGPFSVNAGARSHVGWSDCFVRTTYGASTVSSFGFKPRIQTVVPRLPLPCTRIHRMRAFQAACFFGCWWVRIFCKCQCVSKRFAFLDGCTGHMLWAIHSINSSQVQLNNWSCLYLGCCFVLFCFL